MNEFDDFGDEDLLMNFDVDKAVAQHLSGQSPSPQKTNTTRTTPVDVAEQQQNPSNIENQHNKKRKVSLSPSGTELETSGDAFNETITKADADALRKTLRDIFGYADFRQGQLQVIQQILNQRDVSVYWATGKGKSLCYQVPALHLDQVALVVSPLISLMQDQCHKLNALSNKPLAAYLGSAQRDRSIEEQAWRGAFAVVYLTPEKLTSCLDRLAELHSHYKRIALVAIDEAHTVSEWGTDFRPDFRKLSSLRQHAVLQHIPLLTLTATAVPRVQQDITTVLQLRQPFLARQSLDRKNLSLAVHVRPSNPVSALQRYIALWNDPAVRPGQQSTIVYVATRNQVDQLAHVLRKALTHPAMVVGTYHAGLSPEARHTAHTQFLTGQCPILVATVAFGMGIDKPDTRRIIHYGPAKTMEEYYQQIGRAGRDGAAAEAVLYATGADFDKYQDDFYVGNLPPEARQATLESLQALKDYCLSKSQCRRRMLLSYFGERSVSEHCGNCDYCQQVETFGEDMKRDFRELGAGLVLDVVQHLKEQPLSQILKVLKGSTIETYRCRISGKVLQERVMRAMEAMPRKFATAYFEQILNLLLQHKYLCTKQVKNTNSARYNTSWMVYSLTPMGQVALQQSSQPILLPVPEYLREMERKEEAMRQKVLENLQNSNFKDKIPSEELEQGDGEVIRAYSKWQNYVETSRVLGKTERVQQLDALLASIEDWRTQMATKYQMAPVSVIPEHLLASIAYAVATSPAGSTVDSASLLAAGVRSREMDSLVAVLQDWVTKAQPKSGAVLGDANLMIFPAIPERHPWKFAVYKPLKKTGMTVWEQSYTRYVKGESIQSIAMSPAPGRMPIQVKTVAGHILDALIHGRAVDLTGIVTAIPAPTRAEWEELETAHRTNSLDPVGDPETSGIDHGRYKLTDAIRPIVGAVADIPSAERSDTEKALLAHWFDLLKWFLALKRGGIQPQFQQ